MTITVSDVVLRNQQSRNSLSLSSLADRFWVTFKAKLRKTTIKMKVIESQSAVLTNYEVYQHVVDQRERYKKNNKRRGPPNLETVVREVSLDE